MSRWILNPFKPSQPPCVRRRGGGRGGCVCARVCAAPGSTFLCRVDDCHGAERPFPLVVVHPHFNFVGGEGRQGLVAEDVSGGIRGGHDGLHPADGAEGAESHHVPEAASVLQLLGHCLWAGRQGKNSAVSKDTHLPARLHAGYCLLVLPKLLSWIEHSRREAAGVLLASNPNSSLPGCARALLLHQLPATKGEAAHPKTYFIFLGAHLPPLTRWTLQ